jgi:hypothetical protein
MSSSPTGCEDPYDYELATIREALLAHRELLRERFEEMEDDEDEDVVETLTEGGGKDGNVSVSFHLPTIIGW